VPLKRKIDAAAVAARMTLAVATNTGNVPADYKSMVLIEPTSVCNLACPLCPTGTKTLERENKFIDMDVFDRILEVTAPVAEGYIINLFGEPTFHPRFSDILAKTSRLPTWLSTNLSYGEEAVREMAHWPHLRVICSVDTLDPEKYSEYRVGGNYDTVMRNLEILSKGQCQVYPQFLVSGDAEDEAAYVAFAKRFDIPVANVLLKAKFQSFRLDETDKPVSGVCHSCYTGIYFNCDGYLVPCCNNVRRELYIHHISEINSIDDIYRGERVRNIRRELVRNKNRFKSCGRCPGLGFWDTKFVEYLQCARSLLPGGGAKRESPQNIAF